jgi:hypothetical protein
MITIDMIDLKRMEVNDLYEVYGVGSAQYEAAFDELHDLNMALMASQFRKERGLSVNCKTPYCS